MLTSRLLGKVILTAVFLVLAIFALDGLMVLDDPIHGQCAARWISVDERLPPDRLHLFFVTQTEHTIGVGPGDYEKGRWLHSGRWEVPPQTPVTHWMPYPKPPITNAHQFEVTYGFWVYTEVE